MSLSLLFSYEFIASILLTFGNFLRRGVAAIGGMAAQIPIKNDEAKNNAVMDKVKADKQRECDAGHDGTWVAHPGLVKIALDIFNKGMPGPNQVSPVTR